MALINIQNLTFSHAGEYEELFTDVSLHLDTDWKLGLIGRNGRGKTTFLRLLMGDYTYSGRIDIPVDVEYFPYDCRDPDETAEELFLHFWDEAQRWEMERELSYLDVEPHVLDRTFGTLSGGEQTKVMLAAMFLKPNSFLLIDEPTNHADDTARSSITKYLKNKKGFILVSHDRMLLDEVTDHIMAINRADIEVRNGNYSQWEREFAVTQKREEAENERLSKDIARLKIGAARTEKWADSIESSKKGSGAFDKGYVGHQSAKMMKRAKSLEKRQEKAIEQKSSLLKNVEKTEELKIYCYPHFSDPVIVMDDVIAEYSGFKVNEPVSFSIRNGDRICLSGANGSGKSSIIKIIAGENREYSGTVLRPRELKISYVPQNTAGLNGGVMDYADVRDIDKTRFLTILRKFDFERRMFEKDISELSEGQKKKVLLAASLAEEANMFIWDEPLNYIDIYSRIQLEDLILRFCPTLIFVEHDEYFRNKIANKTVTVKRKAGRG